VTDEQILIDGDLIRGILREKGRGWLAKGIAGAAVLSVLGLCLLPQSFTASSSVAVQTSGGAGGALGFLTGGSSGDSKRYIGVLKSRMAASEVEQVVHLRSLYHLKSEEDAIEMLMKSMKPDDNTTDGLLYVNVTLPGPARFQPGQTERRNQIKRAAADAANAYVAALRTYYTYSDNDRDTALIRGADSELARARQQYGESTDRLRAFVNGLKRVDPRAVPSDTDPAAAGNTGLATLFGELSQTEAQISALQAGSGTEQRMTEGQLENIGQLPSEDPLLASARQAVDTDKAQLSLLELQFGPQHPDVVRAQARLQVDERRLQQQIDGIRDRQTSRQVSLESQLNSLIARRETIKSQIAQAESHLNLGRNLSGDYLSVKTEWQIALETLKETTAEAAKIRMENVSAQSRLAVVDTAIAPRTGSPGTIIIVLIAVILAILGVLTAFVRAYLRAARARFLPAQPHAAAAEPGSIEPGSGKQVSGIGPGRRS
jgi:uncharacterized protein involved in exopolysaccharide biosynthesis